MKTLLDWAQIITAFGAIGAVIAALLQARIAQHALKEQHDATREQQRTIHEDLAVQLLLRYEDRWETPAMMDLRRKLAGQLLGNQAFRKNHVMADSTYEVIGDEVPGFFESLALMHSRGHIDTEATWGFFEHWARRYWLALQSFVAKDRERNGKDVWSGYERLVKVITEFGVKRGDPQDISEAEIEEFLKQEQQVGN
jgi:hypothetical protein